MDTWCDMVSYTAQYMAASIAQHGLVLADKPGWVALLQCTGCTIRLSNIDNDYVRFEFWQPGNEAEVFEFLDYLDCAFEMRGQEIRPLPSEKLPPEEQFVGMLNTYDRLLCEGYFDAPLSGDFGWVAAYHAMLAEVKRLSLARLYLEDAGHPEAEEILRKEVTGDRTWIDDMRRILAEQEGKS